MRSNCQSNLWNRKFFVLLENWVLKTITNQFIHLFLAWNTANSSWYRHRSQPYHVDQSSAHYWSCNYRTVNATSGKSKRMSIHWKHTNVWDSVSSTLAILYLNLKKELMEKILFGRQCTHLVTETMWSGPQTTTFVSPRLLKKRNIWDKVL